MKNNKWIILWYFLAIITLCFLSIHWVWWRFLTTNEWLSPLLVVFLRFFWWVIILSLFLIFFSKKSDFKTLFYSEKSLLKSKNFWLSSIFFFFTLISFNFWTKLTSASDVILIQSLAPIIVLILTVIYYPKKSKNYNFKTIFFITVIASIGSSLLLSDHSLIAKNSLDTKIYWDIISFFAMAFFAFFNFYYVELRKEFENSNWLIITASFLFVWLILSIPFLLIYYNQLFDISEKWIIFIMLISFGSTWIAYLTRFLAGKYLSAVTLILMFNIVWFTTMW